MRTFVVNCTQARIEVWHAIYWRESDFVSFILGFSPVQITTKITWIWVLRRMPKQSSASIMFLCCCGILCFIATNALRQNLTEDVKSEVIPLRPVLSTQIQFAKINIESHRSNELSSPQPSSQMSFYVCWFNASVLLDCRRLIVNWLVCRVPTELIFLFQLN